MNIEWHYNEERCLRYLKRLSLMSGTRADARNRIHEELRVIEQKGLAQGIVLCFRIKEWLRHMRLGQFQTVGVYGGWQVLFSLGIAPLDPLMQGLHYERAWNPLRPSSKVELFMTLPWNAIPSVISLLQTQYGDTFLQKETDADGRIGLMIGERIHLDLRGSSDPCLWLTEAEKIPLDHRPTWEAVSQCNWIGGDPDLSMDYLRKLMIQKTIRNISDFAYALVQAKEYNIDHPCSHYFDCDWIDSFMQQTWTSRAQAEAWFRKLWRNAFDDWKGLEAIGINRSNAESWQNSARCLFPKAECFAQALRIYQNVYIGKIGELI